MDGEWPIPWTGARREIRCPADGSVVTVVPRAAGPTPAAIAAARRAFDDGPWPRTPERERGQLLSRVADLIGPRPGGLRPRRGARHRQAAGRGRVRHRRRGRLLPLLRRHRPAPTPAGWSTPAAPTRSAGSCYEPVGVCALITPWNYPLLQTSWKVAPALAAGNTFVLKPSELTPSTADPADARRSRRPGCRPASPTWCSAPGPRSARPLTERPGGRPGLVHRRRWRPAGGSWPRPPQTVKKVALELGGKNPNIVFADADFETAVDIALTAVFLHSGQVCSAGARLIVAGRAPRPVRRRGGAPGRADPARRAVRRRRRDRRADLGGAPGQGRGVRRGRASPRAPSLRCGGGARTTRTLADGFFYRPTVLDELRHRRCAWCTRSPSGRC